MNTVELSPRILPQPLAPFPGNLQGSVTEISLALNDRPNGRHNTFNDYRHGQSAQHTSPSRHLSPQNTRAIVRTQMNESNKFNYPQDMRLKFYQKLQSNNDNKYSQPRQSSMAPAAFQEPASPRSPVFPRHEYYVGNKPNNYDNDSINQIFKLVEKQNRKIEELKLQIKMLQATHRHELDQIQSQQIRKAAEIKSTAANKISIGVMTSFELKAQNGYRNDDVLRDVRSREVSVHEINSPKGALEKIIENSETVPSQSHKKQPSIRSDPHPIEEIVLDDRGYMENRNDVMPSSPAKVGWTMYKNVVHQVDEILHKFPDTEAASPHISDHGQKCTTKQVKIIETTITTGMASGIESTSTHNRIPVDSSYYPRVNANVMQSSHSTSETNASFHIQALALKYLGDRYQPDRQVHRRGVELYPNFVGDNVADKSISLATKNYIEKYQLDKPPSHTGNVNNENFLDISALRRQPKLL